MDKTVEITRFIQCYDMFVDASRILHTAPSCFGTNYCVDYHSLQFVVVLVDLYITQ